MVIVRSCAVEGVAATSLMTAAARARESARPDALFLDPWADLLAVDTGLRVGAWVQLYADSGAPFVFGTDDPDDLVRSCGWTPVIHLGRDLAAGYGRSYADPPQPGPPPGAIITATLA